MKKLLLLIAMIAVFNAGAQTLPATTTTLTPGNGNFLVDNSKFPFNSVIMVIRSNDTSLVELDLVSGTSINNSVLVKVKPRVKYLDGRTGQPFVSITRLKQFYDSFMVSPAFVTQVAGNVNIISDTATQTVIIARLDSIAKYTSTQGVTVTHIDSTSTFAVPAGSIVLGGLRDSNGALLTVANITNLTTIEKGFLTSFTYGVVPLQSYRALATAHTITANVALNVFILKLN